MSSELRREEVEENGLLNERELNEDKKIIENKKNEIEEFIQSKNLKICEKLGYNDLKSLLLDQEQFKNIEKDDMIKISSQIIFGLNGDLFVLTCLCFFFFF